jgi:hypothetical protein
MTLQRCVASLGVLACLLATGCGTSSVTSSTGAPATPTNLVGNWQLTDTLPSLVPPVPLGMPFALAATFDVSGSAVTARVTMSYSCSNGSGGGVGGTVLTGTVAKDGSFSVVTLPQSPINGVTPIALSIQGMVPSSAGGAWSGSYTLTGGCFTSVTEPIEALSLPSLNSNYAGTVTSINTAANTSTQMSVNLALKQGVNATPTSETSQATSYLISGTLSIQSSSCSVTGGTQTAVVNGVAIGSDAVGDGVLTTFRMSDGSEISMTGYMLDAQAKQMSVEFLQPLSSASSCIFPASGLSPPRGTLSMQ